MMLRPDDPALRAVPVDLPAASRPVLFLIVDTEEEFDWSAPLSREHISVCAIRSLGRLQRLAERYGLTPTYVVDYPVASQPDGHGPLREFVQADACALGAHLHPWVNPSFLEHLCPATSFACNLGIELETAKLRALCTEIGERLGVRPRIYKAGRCGFGRSTAAVLVATQFVSYYVRETGLKNLVLSGGVVANVKLNQRLKEPPGVERVFVHPNMGDGGCGTGAALLEFAGDGRGWRPIPDVFWGPCYADAQIVEALRRAQLPFDRYTPIEPKIARLNDCLDPPVRSPFMLLRGAVKTAWRDRVRAALDHRHRLPVHTVDPAVAPELEPLLALHRQRTGVPGLINLPLGGPAEPMACTPRDDAVRTTFSSSIDALVMGRFLVMKDYWLLRSDPGA